MDIKFKRRMIRVAILLLIGGVFLVNCSRPIIQTLKIESIKKLTDCKGRLFKWSPDGEKIAFIDRDNLYVINSDGTGRKMIANNTLWFSWAPESDRLVYMISSSEIWIAEIDYPHLKRKITIGSSPEWSPQGDKISFLKEGDLWVIDIKKGEEKQLTAGSGCKSPVWLPSGKSIAFYSDRGGKDTIWQINLDSIELFQLSNSSPYELFTLTHYLPTINFSPDGRWLVSWARDRWVHSLKRWICLRRDLFISYH